MLKICTSLQTFFCKILQTYASFSTFQFFTAAFLSFYFTCSDALTSNFVTAVIHCSCRAICNCVPTRVNVYIPKIHAHS